MNNRHGGRPLAAMYSSLVSVPGFVAAFTLWRFVKEPPRQEDKRPKRKHETKVAQHPKISTAFMTFLAVVVLFTLGNSSDLFLIFNAQSKLGPEPAFLIGASQAVAAVLILWLQKVTHSGRTKLHK